MTIYIIIAAILALAVTVIVLTLRGKKKIIFKMLYALVDEAEKQFGSGTGKLKFSYVIGKAYSKLPSILKVLITYRMLERWIEKALVEMKKYWAEKAGITE
jgi:hypothetical protein